MLHPGERPEDSFQEDEDELEGLGIAPRPKMHFLIVKLFIIPIILTGRRTYVSFSDDVVPPAQKKQRQD